MAKGIFRSDNCSYTHDGAKIKTGVAYGEVQNGAPIKKGDLVATGVFSGEREVYTTSAATDANAADVLVVTSVEVSYEAGQSVLGTFTNASGSIVRMSQMEKGDIFSIGGDVVSGTPSATNKYIAAGNGVWTVGSTTTKAFAKYLNTETYNGLTIYGYEVL